MTAIGAGSGSRGWADADRLAASKVPEITLMFWVAKLLTTGMGETTWDWMDIAFGQGIAVGDHRRRRCSSASLVAQFALRGYHAWVYWFAVVMVSVFGTTVGRLGAQRLRRALHGVDRGAAVVLVAAAFALWYRVEGTLSIHSITRVAGRSSTGPRSC